MPLPSELEIIWSGTLERAKIAAAQKPAPATTEIDIKAPSARTQILEVLGTETGRAWSHKEIAARVRSNRTTVATAVRRLAKEGTLKEVRTGINPQKGPTVLFVLAKE